MISPTKRSRFGWLWNRCGMSDTRAVALLVVVTLAFTAVCIGYVSTDFSQRNTIHSQQAQIQTLQTQVSALSSSVAKASSRARSAGSFNLTLEIVAAYPWNSTMTGPKYWVVTAKGLESPANISMPANTLIQLTIVDTDTATPLPSQYGNVTGTVGNVVYVINSTAAAGNFSANSAEAVSYLNPKTQVGHTFTVPQLGLNIPVAADSVEVADFYINQTGTFVWHCEDPCGFGPSGWLGPMNTNGWMGGIITVT